MPIAQKRWRSFSPLPGRRSSLQSCCPEVCYLFLRDAGHQNMTRFVQAFSTSGAALDDVVTADIQRAGDIARRDRDAEFDFVDCCVMTIAERLNVTDVCTYDRRDFSSFRPRHCHSLTLLSDS